MAADHEAAIAAYRANLAERDRLYQAGGADKPTAVLLRTSRASFLDFTMEGLRTVKKKGLRSEGFVRVAGVFGAGLQDGEVSLTSCEDSSSVRLLNRDGKDVTPEGETHYVQSLTVVRSGSEWLVEAMQSKPVNNFEEQTCGD